MPASRTAQKAKDATDSDILSAAEKSYDRFSGPCEARRHEGLLALGPFATNSSVFSSRRSVMRCPVA